MYDKVIQLYTYIFFQISFQYMLLQDIEYGSLHYTVNLCCLSILCIVGSVRDPMVDLSEILDHMVALLLVF